MSGRIETSDGSPVGSALLRVFDWGGSLAGMGVTDSEGRYQLQLNGNGPFRVEVVQGSNSETLRLQPGQLNHSVLHLHLPATVRRVATTPVISVNDLEAPKKAQSLYAKAEQALRAMRLGDAMHFAEEAIRMAPKWGRPYVVRGVLRMEYHDYSAAELDLVTAVQQNPTNATALTELGKLETLTGKLRQSSLHLHQALRYPPTPWPTYYELTIVDLLQGNNREAQVMAQNAERATPAPPAGIHYLGGVAAMKLGQPVTAEQEFRRFIEQAQADPGARARVASARRSIEQLEKQHVAGEPAAKAKAATGDGQN